MHWEGGGTAILILKSDSVLTQDRQLDSDVNSVSGSF